LRVVYLAAARQRARMTTPWISMAVLAVLMAAAASDVVPRVRHPLRLTASDTAREPNPRATSTADPERDKHHGTSGMDPDSMGSSTRRQPGDAKTGHGGTTGDTTDRAPTRR
jgi:hypothetical protein